MTKTHLYGLTQQPNKKNGMVEISVRHPLNSIIKIATKSSCPEIISFTHGEKISKSSSKNVQIQEDLKDDASASTDSKEAKAKDVINAEYNIKGKEWFYVPDYAGEAASAVKMQILEIVDLIPH